MTSQRTAPDCSSISCERFSGVEKPLGNSKWPDGEYTPAKEPPSLCKVVAGVVLIPTGGRSELGRLFDNHMRGGLPEDQISFFT